MNMLVQQWTTVALKAPPFFFPGDREVFKKYNVQWKEFGSYKRFTESPQLEEDAEKVLFLDLIPSPYSGDLKTADIFLLQLNPGFGALDYLGEYENQAYKTAKLDNLKQQLSDSPYPFKSLNPAFAWTGGFKYWESRLRRYIQAIQRKENLSNYQSALSYLSKRLAVIELVPYHSRKGCVPDRAVEALPSSQAIVRLVGSEITRRAKAGAALVIVMRGHRHWQVDHMPRKGLISDTDSFNRGAYFNRESVAGRRLAGWLGIENELSRDE